jgi:hypothetical protein
VVIRKKGVHQVTVANIPVRKTIPLFEAEANARLIAAAPELLEQLKNMVTCFERFEDTHTALVMDAARAVIAKATGETV